MLYSVLFFVICLVGYAAISRAAKKKVEADMAIELWRRENGIK